MLKKKRDVNCGFLHRGKEMEWRELPGSKKADQRIKGFHHLSFLDPALQKRKQSQSIPAMLNGQILNLVSNLSLLSEEIWCLSVESYWILLPLGYYLCHFPFPWCTSLTSSQQKQQQFGCQGEHRLWNTGPTSMMNRPLMFVIWCHTVNAWMSPRELCSADLWTDSACVIKKPLLSSWQKKGKILPVCGECGGQANAPHLSCSRIKSFL